MVHAKQISNLITTIEKDLGSKAKSGKFQITGLNNLIPNKQVVITQAAGPYTGKGTLPDESQKDSVFVNGYVLNSTTIQCYWNCCTWVHGNFKFNYFIQN